MKKMRFLFLLLPFSAQILLAAQMPACKGNAAAAKEEKSKIEIAAISSSHTASRHGCYQRMKSVGSWLCDLTKHMSAIQNLNFLLDDRKEALLKEEWVLPIDANDRQTTFKKTGYHDKLYPDVLEDFSRPVLFSTTGNPTTCFTPGSFYRTYCQNSPGEQFTFFAYLIAGEHQEKHHAIK